MKNAYEQLVALRITNIGDAIKYMKGKKCKVLTKGNHNYGNVGTTFIVNGYQIDSYLNPSSGYFSSPIGLTYGLSNLNGVGGNSITLNQFYIGGNTIKDLEEENNSLKTSILDIEKQLKTNNIKISFMKDNRVEDFDETDFKVFETLNLLENENLSKVDKAKAIAKLIKEV